METTSLKYLLICLLLSLLAGACRQREERVVSDQFIDSFITHYTAAAIAKANVPYIALPVKYNFPNQPEFEDKYPEDLRDVRALHYMRENLVSRTTDFESLSALRSLCQRTDLSGSHELLRRVISSNLRDLEPAPLSNARDIPWA